MLNWLQYFTLEGLKQELSSAELSVIETYSSVAGEQFEEEADDFAVVAVKA